MNFKSKLRASVFYSAVTGVAAGSLVGAFMQSAVTGAGVGLGAFISTLAVRGIERYNKGGPS